LYKEVLVFWVAHADSEKVKGFDRDTQSYLLDIPNNEVREGLLTILASKDELLLALPLALSKKAQQAHSPGQA